MRIHYSGGHCPQAFLHVNRHNDQADEKPRLDSATYRVLSDGNPTPEPTSLDRAKATLYVELFCSSMSSYTVVVVETCNLHRYSSKETD